MGPRLLHRFIPHGSRSFYDSDNISHRQARLFPMLSFITCLSASFGNLQSFGFEFYGTPDASGWNFGHYLSFLVSLSDNSLSERTSVRRILLVTVLQFFSSALNVVGILRFRIVLDLNGIYVDSDTQSSIQIASSTRQKTGIMKYQYNDYVM